MTGAGTAAGATELGDLRVEIRTVNGRGLGIKLRLCSEGAGLESAIEELVRWRLARGSVTVIVERPGAAAGLPDRATLRAFVAELRALASDVGLSGELGLRDVVLLATAGGRGDAVTSRPLPPRVLALLEAAVGSLQDHRATDGAATVAAILGHLDEFVAHSERAAARAPEVVAAWRQRLLARVNEVVAEHGVQLQPGDVVREVALFADRIDVAEELQRLAAHVAETRALLQRGGEIGRKLEFLVQELLRETNTLGSKSPDVTMTHAVVAMKSCIDRIKEQAANLE